MNTEKLKYGISIAALILLFIHLFWPKFGIDFTTIALLVIAALPFAGPLLKYLASLGVKNLELPGGIKIELNDAKAATDKVIRGWAKMELPTIELKAKGSVSTESTDYEEAVSEDPISYIRDVANTDSNLSLVAFRIEVEKRLRKIAERNKLAAHQTSLSRLIRNLENKEILPSDVASGLMDLVALGNRAAHGVKVSDDAAAWVLDVGSSILLELDNLLKD